MSPFLKRVKTVPVLLCSGTDQLSHNAKNSNNFDVMFKRQLIWWYRDNCWSPLLSNAFIRICKNRINCNRIEDFLTIAYQNGNALWKWHWIHLHRVHKFTTPCHENSATHVIHLSFLVGLQKFVSGKKQYHVLLRFRAVDIWKYVSMIPGSKTFGSSIFGHESSDSSLFCKAMANSCECTRLSPITTHLFKCYNFLLRYIFM